MTKILKNTPIFYALIEVRFNPILKIESYIVSIQDTLRKIGYPEYIPQPQIQVVQQNSINAVFTPQNTAWLFRNNEATSIISITNYSISFQTTDYQSHEDMFVKFTDAFSAISKITEVTDIKRIGMRYLNAIHSKENGGEDYLSVKFPSFLEKKEILSELAQTIYKTKLNFVPSPGQIIVKIYRNVSNAFALHDLNPGPLKLKDKFSSVGTQKLVIFDTDHVVELEKVLNVSDKLDILTEALNEIHSEVRNVFNKVTNEQAKKEWK